MYFLEFRFYIGRQIGEPDPDVAAQMASEIIPTDLLLLWGP